MNIVTQYSVLIQYAPDVFHFVSVYLGAIVFWFAMACLIAIIIKDGRKEVDW